MKNGKKKLSPTQISKEDTLKIKSAQIANAVKKVQAGKSLTLGEQRLLEESTEDPQDETPLKSYDSINGIVKVFGFNRAEVSSAKKDGCPAFRNGRVYLVPLIRWLNKEASSDPTEEHVGKWSEELCRVKTLRERIKLSEDEGRVIAFEHVREGLGMVMSIMFGCLDRWASELPPAIKGLSEMEIKKRMDEATERLRVDLKSKLDAVSKEGGGK